MPDPFDDRQDEHADVPPAEWDYTIRLSELDRRPLYPIMDRDSPISGHATFLATPEGPSSAVIYVEPDGENRELYQQALMGALSRALDMPPHGASSTENILRGIFDEIKNIVGYDHDGKVDEFTKQRARSMGVSHDGVEIENWDIIAQGFGVCSHMALGAGALVEMAIARQLIDARANYHRSLTRESGHAWLRVTDSHGRRFILDVAMNYFGPIEQAPNHGWSYYREDEPRPKHVREFVTLNSTGDERLMVGEVIDTTDRIFRANDLDPAKLRSHAFFIVETTTDEHWMIGWDSANATVAAILDQPLPHGSAGVIHPDQDIQLRVSQPIRARHGTELFGSGLVTRITAVERNPIEKDRLSTATPSLKPDPQLTRLITKTQATWNAEPVDLGPAHSTQNESQSQNSSRRIGYTTSKPGQSFNLQETLTQGDFVKAWVHTQSGNTWVVKPNEAGDFAVTNVRESVQRRTVVDQQLSELPVITIGNRVTIGNKSMSPITSITFESAEIATPDQALEVAHGQQATTEVAAEQAIARIQSRTITNAKSRALDL